MVLCDLAQALSLAAIGEDGFPIDVQRHAPDVPAFEAGAPHAGADPLDNQIAFKFSDRGDDDHDGPAQRAAGV